MKKLLVVPAIILSFLICILLTSCKQDKEIYYSHVSIRMTDKPISGLKEVNINIQEVQYHINSGNQTSGWETITTISGTYNILKLVNGFDTILAQANIPTGKISQIRLILGPNHYIKDSLGNTSLLTVPSGSESGLKIQVHETLERDLKYTFLLDFDAAKSIVSTGASTYQLKPVIRLISTNSTGSIKGVVTPALSKPVVMAVSGSDTATTAADANGNYLIKGLDAGTYQVKFYPVLPYKDSVRTGINVAVGNVTVVDTLKF